MHAVRTVQVFAPVALHLKPRALPVVGVLLMRRDNRLHTLTVLAARRDRLQPFRHHPLHIVRHKRQRIHRRHVHAAIPPVAEVHDVPDTVADHAGGVGHAGRHQSRKIRLDLEIDIIGMRIIAPVAAFRSFDTVQQVEARRLVGVPQRVRSMRERIGEGINGRFQAVFLEYFHEGEVHVHIVVQSGRVVVPPFDAAAVPMHGHIILDHRAVVLEFEVAAISASDRLARPSAFDFILQRFAGKFRFRRWRLAVPVPERQHRYDAGAQEQAGNN